MTIRELKRWLEGEIKEADENATASAKAAHNSYGAGYDRGFHHGLKRVELFINDELDE